MQTPWGRLAGLDLASLDLCSEILSRDKHQLAEGLVVECLVDQIHERIPAYRPSAILLDVDTAIARHPASAGPTFRSLTSRRIAARANDFRAT